jgi:subtilisin family serine protease
MERKFDLRLIDAHDLKTLSLRIALFRTETDVFRMVERLGKERDILLAQPNRVFRTMAEPLCEMQKIYRILNLKEVHKYGRGKGVKVAVVDTGVDKNHKDLKARIGSCENFVKRSPYKGEIHGTAVAGVIGASINGYGIVGVAPETEILALRSCRQISEGGPEGECYTSSLSRALDAALAKRADVVNMSFGAAIQDSLLRLLIEEGAKRKIVFTAPAGNRADQKDLWFPASHPKVLAVAGMDQKGHPYPNRDIASKADTCAPATNVFTTIPGSRHNFINGTSMASAVVAGLIAVKISKNGPLNKGALPAFNGDVCKWTEELLRISICEKQH